MLKLRMNVFCSICWDRLLRKIKNAVKLTCTIDGCNLTNINDINLTNINARTARLTIYKSSFAPRAVRYGKGLAVSTRAACVYANCKVAIQYSNIHYPL